METSAGDEERRIILVITVVLRRDEAGFVIVGTTIFLVNVFIMGIEITIYDSILFTLLYIEVGCVI